MPRVIWVDPMMPFSSSQRALREKRENSQAMARRARSARRDLAGESGLQGTTARGVLEETPSLKQKLETALQFEQGEAGPRPEDKTELESMLISGGRMPNSYFTTQTPRMREPALAYMMASSPRLGGDSPASMLPVNVTERILGHLRELHPGVAEIGTQFRALRTMEAALHNQRGSLISARGIALQYRNRAVMSESDLRFAGLDDATFEKYDQELRDLNERINSVRGAIDSAEASFTQ